jgi:hypothetical protein
MLKKIIILTLLNMTLVLGFFTLQDLKHERSYRLDKKKEAKLSLAISNYPYDQLQSSLTQESVQALKHWYESYAYDLKLPSVWEKHYERVTQKTGLASSDAKASLKKISNSLLRMQTLAQGRGWEELRQTPQEMIDVLTSTEIFLKIGELNNHLDNYISTVLDSKLSTKNKELALEQAAGVEKSILEYEGMQEELKLEQSWLTTFQGFPFKANTGSVEVSSKKQTNFFFWGAIFLYITFCTLNFMLLWDWGREKKSTAHSCNSKKSLGLDRLLCSRKAVEKSLRKCKIILNGQTPNFQISDWESHNVLFTGQMQQSLAEVFAEMASHQKLLTRLSLKADERQKVSCVVEASYLGKSNFEESSFFEAMSVKMKKLAEGLRPYKGQLDWECLYNESGPYQVCLIIEFPRAHV